MTKKGSCPDRLFYKKDLNPTFLSGDWYLQETNDKDWPSCWHVNILINSEGTFTGY